MPHRFYHLLTLAALAIIVASPAPAIAQFAVEVHDSIRILRGEQVVDLKVTIRNIDFSPVEVFATREVNEIPEGSTWYTALCFGDLCYPPEVVKASSATIAVGGTAEFKLTVGAETIRAQSDTVRVVVRFDAGPLSDGVVQEFIVISEGVAAAPNEAVTTLRVAWPNPARTSANIPLEPGDRAADGVRLQLVDALGRTVVDMHDVAPTGDGVLVDVSNIADGAYFYRLDVDGVIRNGRIIVAH